jgi:single-strand DNA-binding protein
MNEVKIAGNLTRDPEVRTTPAGKPVLNFSIAFNTRIKNQTTGEWEDGAPQFFDCEFWPKDPQYWIKRLGKGVGVFVCGKLKQDVWQQDGQHRSKVKISVEEIYGRWMNEIQVSQSAPAEQAAPPATQEGNDPPF